MCGNISSALPKGTPVPYLSQMSQIRSLLFKMPTGTEIHLKYILGFSIICFKLIFFFSRRQHTRMLKDYRIIHWWLSEGISKLLSTYNNRYQPKGTQFYFSVWFGVFLFVKFYLVLVKLPNLYTLAHTLTEILLQRWPLICSMQTSQLSGHRGDCLWHYSSLICQMISKWNVK